MDKGAHYKKCDFQVHSPRDINWTGPVPVSDTDREAYATTLIEACRERGLGAVAITDHHDVAFIKYIRNAAAAETTADGAPVPVESQVVVFPGIELTLGVPCQALLILDADFEDARLESILVTLAVVPVAAHEAKTAQTTRLDGIQSIQALADTLDAQPWLKGRYIILPNVTDEKESSLLRRGMQVRYKEMPCVGGYLDGKHSDLRAGSLSILSGGDKAWGNKKVACIQTSDNRRSDHSDLGSSSSWIKWAVPTAEALRQACLAQESRISHEQPELPTAVITAIHVSNSKFLGPVDLELNPQYNGLIGGRGTGKSTILEYIRWALCDQPPTLSDEDTPNYQNRRARLIENTLRPFDATVDVTCLVNGVPHEIRRHSSTGQVSIKIGAGAFAECSENDVRTLFPIQAYSQKQLSDVSVRLDELTRFITSPVRQTLSGLRDAQQQRELSIRQAFAKRRLRQTLEQTLRKRELEFASLNLQAEGLRGQMSGLTAEETALIASGRTYGALQQKVGQWKGTLGVVERQVDELLALIEQERKNEVEASSPAGLPETSHYPAVRESYLATLSSLAGAVAEAKRVAWAHTEHEGPWNVWQAEVEAFRASYQAAVAKSTARKEQMEQLTELEQRLAEHRSETTRLTSELTAVQAAAEVYDREKRAWLDILAEKDAVLARQCETLTGHSNGAIRATIARFSNADKFVAKLKEVLSGSGLRATKLEDLGTLITSNPDPQHVWSSIVDELEHLSDPSTGPDGRVSMPDSPTLDAAGITEADLGRITSKLTPEQWLAMSLVEIESAPVFEYESRDSEYIAFRNASAGQQATALLRALLNQNGPPLLIDQPEEDLDNPVMQEIVAQLWEAKKKRQLVFVSHNANLIVNGDAELVVWCEYRRAGDQTGGKIAGQGAIDVPDVRNAIQRIMEGGEAAFSLRRMKYGF